MYIKLNPRDIKLLYTSGNSEFKHNSYEYFKLSSEFDKTCQQYIWYQSSLLIKNHGYPDNTKMKLTFTINKNKNSTTFQELNQYPLLANKYMLYYFYSILLFQLFWRHLVIKNDTKVNR